MGQKKIWKRISKEIAFKPVAIHLSYNAQVQRPDIWASSPKNWFKTSYAHILVAGFLPGQPKLGQGVALADQQSSLMANPTVRTKLKSQMSEVVALPSSGRAAAAACPR